MSEPTRVRAFGVVDRETAVGVSGLEFLRSILDGTHPDAPFSEPTGIWPAVAERGRVIFEARPSSRSNNPMGTVHGGWLSTLLDSAMGCAVHSALEPGRAYTTVEMQVNFVRPVFEASGRLLCEANLIHMGGRIATSGGRILDAAGRLVAHDSETCLVFDVPASGTPA